MSQIITSDVATADSLGERVFGSVLGALDVFSIYVGDRLGYYRSLSEDGDATSTELAERSKTTERYTREWLEQQAVSGLVEHDGDPDALSRRYHLPEGYAEALTEELSRAYVAPFVRMIAAAGFQLPKVVEAHRSGGGVAWAEYGEDMRESQGAMNRPFFANLLGTEWFPSVPELHDRLSDGARVADIGTGFGWSSIAIGKSYPKSTVDGYDIDLPSIESASASAQEEGVADRVKFSAADAATSEGTYDVVTAFECIHDLGDPVEVLRTMRRMAGEDGYVVVMDEKVAHEFGATDEVERVMYGFSNFICLPEGMSHQGSVGTGTVIRPDTLREYARSAGFSDIEILPIETDLWRFYRLVQ